MGMLESGQVIGTRYRLEEHIGGGGMGSVWRATQIALQRPVAIKFLYARGSRPDIQAERFLREARIAASVIHRNVVDTLDFGVSDEGEHYMVMSLLEGLTLAHRLEQSPPLSINELIRIISLSLRGLGAVHDAGIIHRDLKPENIFLVNDLEGAYPKLLDFGISRILDAKDDARRSALTTKEGVMVGTPQYMSPEQVRGIKDLDKRTDIYSMGVILYEALTGRLPFDAEAIGDLMLMIVAGEAPTVLEQRPEVGSDLSRIVERAMARNRELRFNTALEMQKALIDLLEKVGAVRPYPMLSVMPRPIRSNFPPPVKIVGLEERSAANANADLLIKSEEISLVSLLEGPNKSASGPIATSEAGTEHLTIKVSHRPSMGRQAISSFVGRLRRTYSASARIFTSGYLEKTRVLLVDVAKRTYQFYRGRYRVLAVAGTALAIVLVGSLLALLNSNVGVAAKPAMKNQGAAESGLLSRKEPQDRETRTERAPSAQPVHPTAAIDSPVRSESYTLKRPGAPGSQTLVLDANLTTFRTVPAYVSSYSKKEAVNKRDRSLRRSRKGVKKPSPILRHPDF
jgi:serine/threonine protein kinase